MEKILVAVDPNRVNTNVIDFACFLAKLTRSELTAIFLESGQAAVSPARSLGRRLKELISEPAAEEKRDRTEPVEDHIDFFHEACINRGVRASVHIDSGMPVKEIVMESRFADLLVLDPEMPILDEVLAKSECPVVIAPYAFYGIDEILFVYDGTAASLFSIKQFAYLFPELNDNRITVAEINTGKEGLPLAEKKMLGSFLQMHYSSIGFRVLLGNSDTELLTYLLEKKNIFVVTGNFEKLASGVLLKAINLPVFVAHQ